MKFRDIATMAVHNLWSRKLRTILNLLGIVISCNMLMMTFAGTRGASEGIHSIINQSDQIRRFMIRRTWGTDEEPPESAVRVEGEMSEERRERIKQRLRDKWEQENAPGTLIDEPGLKRLRELPHVISVAPNNHLVCRIVDGQKETPAMTTAVQANDDSFVDRLLFGQTLDVAKNDGMLVDEFTAYSLGYTSDQQLADLVGKQLTVKHHIGSRQLSELTDFMNLAGGSGNLSELAQLMLAIKKLNDDLDSTSLSHDEKELLRRTFEKAFNNDAEPKEPESPAGDKETEDDGEKARPPFSPQLDGFEVTIDDNGMVFLSRDFFVRGIIYTPKDEGMWSFLNFVHSNDFGGIYLSGHIAEDISFQREHMQGYYAAVGEVDEVRHLRTVIDEIEEAGYGTSSAVRIVERVDREIGKVRIAIAAIAMLILVIAAIGITNTMVIAVLERTPEFGIMKSLGARDGHVLTLMLLEGALTGLLGAGVALLISIGTSGAIDRFVRGYIESRIGEKFTQSTFVFTSGDLLIVFLVSALVCTLASLLPAWRAARLDPVVAMRRG